jgi:L-asparaginase
VSQARKIVILGTGGTIAGQGASNGGSVGYKAGQIGVAQLLQPMLQGSLGGQFEFVVAQVAQLDSKDMDIATWQLLAKACSEALAKDDVAGIVITHGTDTLEETAWFLQSVLGAACKPVVLTCAMRPATALSADGPANLRDAVLCAASGVAGVWMCALGEVHAAQHVRKVHPYRLNAFASGAQGPAGWVEEGRVRWVSGLPLMPSETEGVPPKYWQRCAEQWPWVEIVISSAAARPQAVDALVAAGVNGLVVASTGNGSVHVAMQAALHRAAAQGVTVWRSTRCEQGAIVLADGERDPLVSALSPVKARISLMLQLLCASS